MIKSNTCILVLKDEDTKKLVFGADRRISFGNSFYQKTPRSKICKRNGLILAGSGNAYLSDLVIELTPITFMNNVNESPFQYIHTEFYNALSKILMEKRIIVDNKVIDNSSAAIMIGLKGDLFLLNISKSGISIDVITTPFALGCGGDVALGSALVLLKDKNLSIKEILRKSVKTASLVSAGCDSTVDIVEED